MLKVGLTGGIASGKTVVREHWASQGVPTVDADMLVHRLFAPPSELRHRIAEAFGCEILRDDGSVDRKALGAIVFADPAARERLNALVHPAVWEAIDVFLAEGEVGGEALSVVDAALMFETGSTDRYDLVVVVSCPRELQLERLLARAEGRLNRADAERRVDAQWPTEKKTALADYVIDTSGSLTETLANADRVLAELKDRAQVE